MIIIKQKNIKTYKQHDKHKTNMIISMYTDMYQLTSVLYSGSQVSIQTQNDQTCKCLT